jgi:phosphate acetyltransferase
MGRVQGLYIVGCERACGLLAIALGVHDLMARRFGRLGVFRRVVAADGADPVLSRLCAWCPA